MTPTTTQYEEMLADVRESIERLDDEIVEEITNENDELKGFRCSRGNHTYVVHGRRSDRAEYINVTYPYNLLIDFSRALTIQQHDGTEEELKEKQIDIDGGRQKLTELAKNNPEQHTAMREELVDYICTPDSSYAIQHDNGVITAFEVTNRVFPYEDGFSLSDLHSSVQTVIGVGIPARNFLQRAHGISPNAEVPDSTKPEDDVEGSGDPEEDASDNLRYIS